MRCAEPIDDSTVEVQAQTCEGDKHQDAELDRDEAFGCACDQSMRNINEMFKKKELHFRRQADLLKQFSTEINQLPEVERATGESIANLYTFEGLRNELLADLDETGVLFQSSCDDLLRKVSETPISVAHEPRVLGFVASWITIWDELRLRLSDSTVATKSDAPSIEVREQSIHDDGG